MDYTYVPWPLFARGKFFYNNPNVINLDAVTLQVRTQLISCLYEMNAQTFRALVRPLRNRNLSFTEGKFLATLGNVQPNLANPVLLMYLAYVFSLMVNINCNAELLYITRIRVTLDSNSEDDHVLFAFSVIDGIPTIWTDQIITVSITVFINETLEIYNAQLSLERQAAQVNRSLIELPAESPRTSTLDGHPQDQSFEDPPVYSQGTTFSNESASNTICTDDGQQTLQFTKENNGFPFRNVE